MAKMISITEDGMFISSEPMYAVDFVNLMLNATMQLFQQQIKHTPDEEQQKIKEELYDLFNEGASAFLKAFAPDIELRPDLTAEAILAAENELIEETAHTLQGNSMVKQSAARIRQQMIKDGVITPVRQTEDGNLIPLNRKERRSTKK